MKLYSVNEVYLDIRDKLIDCKVSLCCVGLQNSLIYRVISTLIDFLNDLL